jgi:hypothetical protein
MDEKTIKDAWIKLEKLFGPDYFGRDATLKDAAQVYATAVLESNDKNRVDKLGKRHLNLVKEKMLEGKQFSNFLTHVIQIERL